MNKWYEIKMAGDNGGEAKEAEVFLYDNIGGWGITANDFIADLREVGPVDTLHIRISSGGGDVIDGHNIYNAIKRYKGKTVAHIDSLAASIASVIAMAADEVHMAANSLLMIHDPTGGAYGSSEELRKRADLLDQVKVIVAQAYSRSSYTGAEITELMSSETYFTAAEALEAGFVDHIEGANLAAANITEFESFPKLQLPSSKLLASVKAGHAQEIANKDRELEAVKSDLQDAKSESDTLRGEIENLQGRIEKLNTTHRSELQDFESRVAAKAAELVAGQTIPPLETAEDGESTGAKSHEELMSQYSALKTHKERREFRREHAEVLNKVAFK